MQVDQVIKKYQIVDTTNASDWLNQPEERVLTHMDETMQGKATWAETKVRKLTERKGRDLVEVPQHAEPVISWATGLLWYIQGRHLKRTERRCT